MTKEETDAEVEQTEAPASTPPRLTEEAVKEALRQAAPGANELTRELKEVFALTDASATLRLR